MRKAHFVHLAVTAFFVLGLAFALEPGEEEAPFSVRSTVPHPAQILNNGVAALELRLEMIERARKSIDLEYFIFNTDRSGRLIAQALVKKKRENPGIRIRLLIDGSPTVLQFDDFYAAELARHGVEIRYYNPKPLFLLVSTQYRNHRKGLIIDGEEAVTGGRNIADEYFEISKTYNFNDRDIWIRGPIVASMQAAFDQYWDHKRSHPFTAPQEPRGAVHSEAGNAIEDAALMDFQKKLADAANFLFVTEEDLALREEVRRQARPVLADSRMTGECVEPWYVTDKPGFKKLRNSMAENRVVGKAIGSRIAALKKGERLYVESPYFILKEYGRQVFESLVERGVHATLLTNSLGSTDAFYVAAIFNPRVRQFSEHSNVELYIHSGKAFSDTLYVRDADGKELARGSGWGVHAKTNVIGEDSFSIGTFNIDPRSANINTEEVLFCDRSPALTSVVRDDVLKRIHESRLLGQNGRPVDAKGELDGASTDKVVFYLLSVLPASMLDFLF